MIKTPSLYLSSDDHDSSELTWPLSDSMIIGRENADIIIELPCLSRQHALVNLAGSQYQIRDMNSKNGTAVNGTLLDLTPHDLQHGDTILLAGMVELTYNDPNATPIAPRLGKLKGLWIDPVSQDVWIDAEKLNPPLSGKQAHLIQLIADANGKLLSRDDIIQALWPSRAFDSVSNDAVDSLIKRLRLRLAAIEHGSPVLENIRGRGIRLIAGR